MSKSVYRPKNDLKYRRTHKEHRRYLSYRGTARSFVRKYATPDDWADLTAIWKQREKSKRRP